MDLNNKNETIVTFDIEIGVRNIMTVIFVNHFMIDSLTNY